MAAFTVVDANFASHYVKKGHACHVVGSEINCATSGKHNELAPDDKITCKFDIYRHLVREVLKRTRQLV